MIKASLNIFTKNLTRNNDKVEKNYMKLKNIFKSIMLYILKQLASINLRRKIKKLIIVKIVLIKNSILI